MDTYAYLYDALSVLTNHQERVLFLHHWHGMTEEQISVIHECSRNAVHRTLSSCNKKIEKYFEDGAQFPTAKAVYTVERTDGTVERGNGQPPDTPRARKAPASLERPAMSQNPRADVYDGMPQARQAFLDDLNDVCASAFLQLMGKGGYNERAAENREMVARGVNGVGTEKRKLAA